MNLSKCRRCGRDIAVKSRFATNKRFCSKDCYDTWWSDFKSRRMTTGQVIEKRFGPVPALEMSEVERAWLAALVDGEGTVGIWRENRPRNVSGWYYKPAVQIVNSNRELLEAVVGIAKGRVVWKNAKRQSPRHKPTYAVTFGPREVQRVLEQIRPYLVAKQKQADVVLEFCRIKDQTPMRASQNHDIYESLRGLCRALNRRGTSGG